MKKILFLICFFVLGTLSVNAEGPDRSVISDWYIKDFQTEITVNSDRSLNIIENIVADCGNLPYKHGIFRIVPKSVERAGKVISLPLKLKGITDFDGNEYVYDSSFDFMNNTQIWKIGDPEKTVSGENDYLIAYSMKNAVYTLGETEDELYWNILGNFWELEVDSFSARLVLPDGLNKSNTSVEIFSGLLGTNTNSLKLSPVWISDNVLEINANNLKIGDGITLSLKFPKGVFELEVVSNFFRNLSYLFFLIPFICFLICFSIWKKHGKDFQNNKSIMPEFYPPKNMSILEMGAILKNGKINKNFLSAEFINLAVKGFLTIEQKKLFWFFGKTYILTATDKKIDSLSEIEIKILEAIFSGHKQVSLHQIKQSFYISYQRISKDVISKIDTDGLFNKKSLTLQTVFIVLSVVSFFLMSTLLGISLSVNEAFSFIFLLLFLSVLAIPFVFLFFGLFMAQRTQKGEDVLNSIKGFKMYMETAEKHRQKFMEKENIFEKYLPYAVAFGITKKWISAFKNIYGPKHFENYAPYWILGANMNFSDLNSLSGFISSVSNDIGGSLGSSSSSSSGGGSSGGGGGGGGGGGW